MSSQTIESVLNETRMFPPSAEFVKQANISGMDAYNALCAEVIASGHRRLADFALPITRARMADALADFLRDVS